MTTLSASHRDLHDIAAEDCWALVRSRSLGRFAANRHGSCPLVVPVNYVVDGDEIVFRSGAGAKLKASVHGHVGLQVDEVDPQHRTGWSVLVEGTGRWLYEEQDAVDLDVWAPGERPYVIRITATRLTGRRIDLAQLDTDGRGYR
jgi:nitroimidazol reductase NimA-like FMN-containing flavoprotein (pyridoxamine 5'-phosphate oxidase superfamily)